MSKISFKSWFLNEVGTTSSGIAQFQMPIGLVRRNWPNENKIKIKKKS